MARRAFLEGFKAGRALLVDRIMIFVGAMLYLAVTGALEFRSVFPFALIVVGAIVIVGVVVGAFTARQRNPTPET